MERRLSREALQGVTTGLASEVGEIPPSPLPLPPSLRSEAMAWQAGEGEAASGCGAFMKWHCASQRSMSWALHSGAKRIVSGVEIWRMKRLGEPANWMRKTARVIR